MNNTEELARITRALIRGRDDLQTTRIRQGNRLVMHFRKKLGITEGKKSDEPKILEALRVRYELITDGIVATLLRGDVDYEYDGTISNFTELFLVNQYLQTLANEEMHNSRVKVVVHDHPIWDAFLKGVKGCGEIIGGVLISEIDIHKARYVSSLWKYAGMDVAEDGRGRSRREEHLVDVEYENKNKEIKTKKSITFNPFLKTKLMGVLAPSFLKCGGEYRDIYDGYRHRLDSREDLVEASKGRKHNMAMRYSVKMFLMNLYAAWKEVENLPAERPYHETKLGIIHKAEGL